MPRLPDALTHPLIHPLTRATRFAYSLARFLYVKGFNQPIGSWDTGKVTDMSYMWVLTSTDWPSRAPPP